MNLRNELISNIKEHKILSNGALLNDYISYLDEEMSKYEIDILKSYLYIPLTEEGVKYLTDMLIRMPSIHIDRYVING